MTDEPESPDAPFPKRARWFWLRVAVSTFFGLLTVALCVLWVRSYWYWDSVRAGYPPCLYAMDSANGEFAVGGFAPTDPDLKVVPSWKYVCGDSERSMSFVRIDRATTLGRVGFAFGFDGSGFGIAFPYWFPVMLCSGVGLVLWKNWTPRFSLRTLLIATTLLAVVLGLLMWTLQS
jgi:hypothetical protein